MMQSKDYFGIDLIYISESCAEQTTLNEAQLYITSEH